MSDRFKRLSAVLAALALLGFIAAPMAALADPPGDAWYEFGAYDDDDYANDWYYDSYVDEGNELFDDDWSDYEAYQGGYDYEANDDDDWFYDYYDDADEEGLFDL